MTGRCQRPEKIMGRDAEEGCGVEENPRRQSNSPAEIPATSPAISEVKITAVASGVDYFSQALKAVSEHSPFDVEDVASDSSVSTLPSVFANLLSKNLDGRKKQKKSQSGADGKLSKSKAGRRSTNIWTETEECFRELAFPDIKNLLEVSTFGSLDVQKCFSIPAPGNAEKVGLGNEVVVKEEVEEGENKVEDEQLMEIEAVGTDEILVEEKGCSVSMSVEAGSNSLEWILGSKNRILLTSERPSKKRKLLGSDAGLEKLLICCPVEGNSASICHFCCLGDIDGQENRLIVCSSCKVAVHRKCYGLQDDVGRDECWVCSWCKHKDDSSLSENVASTSDRPCMFCPKQGGALKVVHKCENGGDLEFAHLFCSLWMPEVYVETMETMSPIMNVAGIKDTRKKLICNICKVKCGACVRCSNGVCRTSFHPICAREASQRLEVWGKFGCDNIELRAFCSKHSETQNINGTQYVGQLAGTDVSSSCITDQLPGNKPLKLKISQKNGDKDTDSDCELHSVATLSGGSNLSLQSYNDDVKHLLNMETTNNEDKNTSDSKKITLVLKKLVDQGKVDMKDVALEIGVAPDLLSATLADDHLVPDMQFKIVKWLKSQAYARSPKKKLIVKIKSRTLTETEIEASEDSNTAAISDSANIEHDFVKSVLPRRRMKSNLKDEKIRCAPDELSNENGMLAEEVKNGQPPDRLTEEFLPSVLEKIESVRSGDCVEKVSPKIEGNLAKPSNFSLCEIRQTDVAGQNIFVDCGLENSVCSVIDPIVTRLMNVEGVCASYIHPSINKKLVQIQIDGMLSEDIMYDFDVPKKKKNSPIETSSCSTVCYNHLNEPLTSPETINKDDKVDLEQLTKAREMGIPELSPKDEVEGELIYFQHRLLGNAVNKKRLSDDLIGSVVKSLPNEIDDVRSRRWDFVLANQYLYELREAKKQGRKEKRHKEAQAVLAAATAAAASSSRISSLRKDSLDESTFHENLPKVNLSSGRAANHSQLMTRPKEIISRVPVSRLLSETAQSTSDITKEHPRSCDICRRSETVLNAILVCSSCKVAVHLDCYRSVKDFTGPWHCELCEELLSSRSCSAPVVNSWEKPIFFAECGICGGSNGAFRKSTDDQWIHAFCAEWVFDSVFRRGQVNPIEGMETVMKGNEFCCVCRHKKGICIKCNYGHCHSTFHPSCARSAGFYMNIRAGGGKVQRKAYCEKHSLEQRSKAETQKHGAEELKSVKQIRVELERLRLLCERIIKREKIKRELILCSHDILASKRNSVALTTLVRSPFIAPDISSESATTSLKVAYTDDIKSCSEAIQRSDDITVDSTVSTKPPASMDNDQKTDDSSTSHQFYTRKPAEKRVPFSGKQLPLRASSIASRNLSDDGENKSKFRKHTETFEKELVMTSDQASMKNQRLPKGFVYVPIGSLSKEEKIKEDSRSGNQSDPNG